MGTSKRPFNPFSKTAVRARKRTGAFVLPEISHPGSKRNSKASKKLAEQRDKVTRNVKENESNLIQRAKEIKAEEASKQLDLEIAEANRDLAMAKAAASSSRSRVQTVNVPVVKKREIWEVGTTCINIVDAIIKDGSVIYKVMFKDHDKPIDVPVKIATRHYPEQLLDFFKAKVAKHEKELAAEEDMDKDVQNDD